MGVCLDPVHETGTLALSQAAHPVPSIHSHFFASCQLKSHSSQILPLGRTHENHGVVCNSHIFNSLIWQFNRSIALEFSIYVLAAFLSS